MDDFTICGGVPGRVRCNGECCSPTECCNPVGFCEECGPHCRIGGVHVDDGTVRPDNACLVCDPDVTPIDWSPAADNTVCGGDLNDELVCCRGACCGPRQCCTGGACGSCHCTIDGVVFAPGSPNPNDGCEICNPVVSTSAWWSVPNDSPCGAGLDQVCCNGICCNPNRCCSPFGNHSCDIETCGATSPCADPDLDPCGCTIAGVFYPVGTENPANDCQYCLVGDGGNATSWTNRSANLLCGPGGHDHCCNGVCCEPAACCNVAGVCELGGSVICGGCGIDGVDYRTNAVNPVDPCQVCVPELSPTSRSPVCSDACFAPLSCVHDGPGPSHCGVPE